MEPALKGKKTRDDLKLVFQQCADWSFSENI